MSFSLNILISPSGSIFISRWTLRLASPVVTIIVVICLVSFRPQRGDWCIQIFFFFLFSFFFCLHTKSKLKVPLNFNGDDLVFLALSVTIVESNTILSYHINYTEMFSEDFHFCFKNMIPFFIRKLFEFVETSGHCYKIESIDSSRAFLHSNSKF